jgi:hypothetical protein
VTYTKTHQALGASSLSTKVSAGIAVAKDPALNELACLVLRLQAVTEGTDPGPKCPKRTYSAAQKMKGVGLYQAIPPLRAWLWVRENPILAAAAGAGVVVSIGVLWTVLSRRKS